MPGPQVCVGGCLRVAARGMAVGARLRGGVGDAAPYGLPGNGRQRKPAPHPALRGHLPPRGKARVAGEGFIPPGVLAAAEGRGGVGAPRPTYGGIWKRLRGLRGHPFPGRRTVGAGHARPGGWREHPSMVRSVGRGLDPSAGDCPGDGRWRKVSGASGTPPPTACPGMGGSGSLPLIRPCGATFPQGGRQGLQGRDSSLPGCWRRRKVAAGWGHPALRMGGYGNACGVYAGTRSRAAAR